MEGQSTSRAPNWTVFMTALQESANVSTATLARQLKMSDAALYNLLHGRVIPRQTTINKIRIFIRNEYPNEVEELFALMPETPTSHRKTRTPTTH